MTSTMASGQETAAQAALAPVRAELLRRAREQAAGMTAGARRQAAEAVDQAHRDAARQLTQARAAGEAQAAPLAAAVRTDGRREARAILLAAQRAAYEELRERVAAEVTSLRDGPDYAPLLARLRREASQAAGPGAVLTEVPAGGIVARGPGIVVDCSLPRLADAAVAALGDRVAWLWTPAARGRRP
jgi:vacuolar-type H+-ATPase subunit E/Vma4